MILFLFLLILFGLISLSALSVFVFAARHYWKKLDGTEKESWTRKAFLLWVFKGLGVPVLFWLIINSGIFRGLPPLLPQVAEASPGWERWFVFSRISLTAIPIIGSYWAMVTFGWLLGIIFSRTAERREFQKFCLSGSLLLAPVFALTVIYLGWGFAGVAGSLWLVLMVSGTIEMAVPRKVPLFYSRAIAAMQFDKYDDAEVAIIKELEKCEDDFTGWMMLAELYATRFNDLKGADQTVRETCDQPNIDISQVNVAFHRLADWHLACGEDPVSAREALAEICLRFPNTHLDRMARARMDQIPLTRDELIEQRRPKAIRLPIQAKDLNGPAIEQKIGTDDSESGELKADRFIEKLRLNPDDIVAREELAVIFTRDLQRAESGIEQLELLLRMPDQPENKSAEWLGLIAAWQLRYLDDLSAAQKTFERLFQQYPQSPQAFAAHKRLESLKNKPEQNQQA